MALSGSWHSCIFIFKVSDFIASQKFLKRQNTLQYANVSSSTLAKTLSANKDILERWGLLFSEMFFKIYFKIINLSKRINLH